MTSSVSDFPIRIPSGRGASCWLFPLFLVLVTFIAYVPAWHGGFVWKDDEFIVHDPRINFWQGLDHIWLKTSVQYYPLTYTTFWIEYHIWGMNPQGYHLVNILFHALNAILIWVVLLRLNVPGAWLAAAIFALHPVNVESVAWIVERKNTLSTLFYLCSILAALKFWLPGETALPGIQAPDCLKDWKFYCLSLVLFICALFSKTTTLPMPAVVLLLVWWKRGGITWRDIYPCIPFVAAGVAVGLITHHVEHNLGASGKEFQFSLVDRVLLAARNFWFYLGKLVWPHPLMFVYPRWHIDPASPIAWTAVLAIVLLGAVLWRARGAWGRPVFVALAYFGGMLFLMLGFFNIFFFLYSFVSDHFVYLACMGPIALVAAGITVSMRTSRTNGALNAPYLVVCGCLLAVLAGLTWSQSRAYADAETLWRDTISKNPNAFLARNNLGDLLVQKGQLDAAIEQYKKSVAIHPDPGVFHNLGNALLTRGRPAEAWAVFQKELQFDPGSASAYADFGGACLQIGRTRDAVQYLQQAYQKTPNDAMICYNLGNAYSQNQQLDAAIEYWQKAVALEPFFSLAHNNLANAMIFKGRISEAVQHWERALAVQPDLVSAQVNLAWVLATCPDPSLRNGPDALALAERAMQLTGGMNPMVLRVLAAAFAENGQYADAMAVAQKAYQLAGANRSLATTIQGQFKYYQNHQPYRDQALTGPVKNANVKP